MYIHPSFSLQRSNISSKSTSPIFRPVSKSNTRRWIVGLYQAECCPFLLISLSILSSDIQSSLLPTSHSSNLRRGGSRPSQHSPMRPPFPITTTSQQTNTSRVDRSPSGHTLQKHTWENQGGHKGFIYFAFHTPLGRNDFCVFPIYCSCFTPLSRPGLAHAMPNTFLE